MPCLAPIDITPLADITSLRDQLRMHGQMCLRMSTLTTGTDGRQGRAAGHNQPSGRVFRVPQRRRKLSASAYQMDDNLFLIAHFTRYYRL